LEVQLWKDVSPIAQLNDEKELGHKSNANMWIAIPEEAKRLKVALLAENVESPANREQVEGEQLTRLVELVCLGLAQANFATQFVKHILLNDGMKDDGSDHVEEDETQVLDAICVENDGRISLCQIVFGRNE